MLGPMPVIINTRPPAVTRRPWSSSTPAEHGDPVDGPSLLQALDGVPGCRRGGVALGGGHHGDGGFGRELGFRPQLTGGGSGQELGQVAGESGQDHLGLGVSEADVVLEHLRAVGG